MTLSSATHSLIAPRRRGRAGPRMLLYLLALAMSGSTVLVAINALLLKRTRLAGITRT